MRPLESTTDVAIPTAPIALATRRAEARTRYYTREEAERLGWDVRHPSKGGRFLEEQELVDYFPTLKAVLGQERPDFATIGGDGKLRGVIECKGNSDDLDRAVSEAREYAETINKVRGFDVRLAVGIAGTPDRFVRTRGLFRCDREWIPLQSHGFPLTQLPTVSELQVALENNNGTTDVQLPDEREFFDAAIKISRILRLARIEEAVRPKVIGAIILALFRGDFALDEEVVLEHINSNVKATVGTFKDVPPKRREFLTQTLTLSTESDRLRSAIPDVVNQLDRLNVRSIMRSGVDFLGSFYETFLRYGQDSKKLGVVFTPRHITRFCAELVNTELGMTVYDPASGTGGFLVAAFDRMMSEATTDKARAVVKSSLYGADTNPTVWALAILNMFFRGDGKSYIAYGSCFDQTWTEKFDRVLMNPPFSQEGEPETMFVDHALENLRPGGQLAVVIKTNVLVDSDLKSWREDLVANHHVMGVISLPQELFYPTAAPTSILIVKAHSPDLKRGTFLARIQNDGYRISKKRRIAAEGSQLPETGRLFGRYINSKKIDTVPNFAMIAKREQIENGEEICAEKWLPSASFNKVDSERGYQELMRQMSLAVVNNPDVIDELLDSEWYSSAPNSDRPMETTALDDWFDISTGRSSGVDGYPGGTVPYISSGDIYNGIVDLVSPPESEIYDSPHLTVSAFGQAYLQPWRFCARGNGGSAVRVLNPKFRMSLADLMWIAAQINAQRWRFHYGRMATVARLKSLQVDPPAEGLREITDLATRLRSFRRELADLADGVVAHSGESLQDVVESLAKEWREETGHLSSIERKAMHPAYQRIIALGRPAVPFVLKELDKHGGHWFWALGFMTGENPLKNGDTVEQAAAGWIGWGKRNGYL